MDNDEECVNKTEHKHVGSVFTQEEQKKLARDVFELFATRTSLVYDVSDTDCWDKIAAFFNVVFSGLSIVDL